MKLNNRSWNDNFIIGASLGVLLGCVLNLSILGCGAVSAPPPPIASGYSSAADQTLGQSLAALNAFVLQEKINYAQLTAAQQAPEKPFLNTLIDATDVANAAYTAFHAGTGTLTAAQSAESTALTAQANLTAKKASH